VQCHGLDKRSSSTVSALDATVHIAKKVAARMLARKMAALLKQPNATS
jgi:hypothetical protein